MRMIERWFPCSEVSQASAGGWGSGRSEKALFTWFAARPLAQAKAAVLTSLLPWPEDESEQRRLQGLVRAAMTGRDAASAELSAEIVKANPDGASLVDVFSGRGMIPLEAARLGARAYGIDYSPVAALASQLLTDYPLRRWDNEPRLPFGSHSLLQAGRLMDDVAAVLEEIGRRYDASVRDLYPQVEGEQPWGYLWAVTLPCDECGNRFPLTGSLVLRHPLPKKGDPGQSYRIEVDRAAGTFQAIVLDGMPTEQPTLVATLKGGKAARGKAAICPFCGHVHPKATHTRLASEGQGRDELLVAADLDQHVGKRFRQVTPEERAAAHRAEAELQEEPALAPGLPAVPNEHIPAGNNHTIRPSLYGANTYGDLCNSRQTLAFARLTGVIARLGTELVEEHGLSSDYAAALIGYSTATLVRKLKSSTRGATLRPFRDPRPERANTNPVAVNHIFTNEASLAFSYDYFETGLGTGPGTWHALSADLLTVLRNQVDKPGVPAEIQRGSATTLPFRRSTFSAVVTDPPYDNMIDYSDASDFFFVWLKRALFTTSPWFSFTSHPDGVQEKDQEAIVKGGGNVDHRTREHYNDMIARAFSEARRVVRPDGVVTIVFGHGDPEVWHRLLGAITQAGLILTGSWPAKTEAGGSAGSANIVTTLTMSCRPAPTGRTQGRANLVESEVRREVQARIPVWDAAGLAPTDQLMASAGPAMEAVGRYGEVLDHLGEPVDPSHYLVVARKAVIDATSVPIENLPLDTFDARTRFALGWARLYRRSVAPKSEARWQALAADLTMDELKGVLMEGDKGVRLVPAKDWKGTVAETSSVIDVAMAMARAWTDGLDEVAQVLAAAQRDEDDAYLWATLGYLSSLLPEGDPDAVAWTSLVRARRGIGTVARGVVSAQREADEAKDRQRSLFDTEMAGETS